MIIIYTQVLREVLQFKNMSFQVVGVFDRGARSCDAQDAALLGWNTIPHLDSHFARELRSSGSIRQSSGLLICRYTMQSSKKSIVLETMIG